MDIRGALLGQYGAGLAMLRQSVDACPDDLWLAGEHPRTYWRIAFHAIFYTHLYLQPGEETFIPWDKSRNEVRILWETPPVVEPYSRADVIEYIDLVIDGLKAWVNALDLDSETTGFDWYPNMGKLDHQLLNVRHLQEHVGQLSELLMARGVDVDWVSVIR